MSVIEYLKSPKRRRHSLPCIVDQKKDEIQYQLKREKEETQLTLVERRQHESLLNQYEKKL